MTEKAAPTTPQPTEGDSSPAAESPIEQVEETQAAPEAAVETAGEAQAEPTPVAESPIEQVEESQAAPEAAIETAGEAQADPTPVAESPIEQVEETQAAPEAAVETAGEAQADPTPVAEASTAAKPSSDEPRKADTDGDAEASAVAESTATPVEEVTATAPEAEVPAAEGSVEQAAPDASPTEADSAAATPAAAAPAEEEGGEIAELRQAKDAQTAVEGKVIGWNNGGFHVVVGELTAFCPRSEMEIASPKAPRNYVDKTFEFHVLKVQKKGRRVVLSRASHLRGERSAQRDEIRDRLSAGSIVKGKVASLTDFGAFVDLGGVQGLVHVSEISRNRINSPSDVLEVGQEIEVKVLKLEKGGRRISLSMRALEPDPWREVKEKFPEGSTQIGKVEKAATFGAFIALEPGLTGLLPLSAMSIPRDTSPARVYPPGREVKVLVMSVDSRRRRISLALPGSTLEGTQTDFKSYVKEQNRSAGGAAGFNAMEAAFKRIGDNADS